MTTTKDTMNLFEVASLLQQMAVIGDSLANIIESPGFDSQTRLLVDEALGGKPAHAAIAMREAAKEIRADADRRAARVAMGAAATAASVGGSRARSAEWPDMIAQPITNLEAGKAFIRFLVAHGLEFHFEDDPSSIVTFEPGVEGEPPRTFTDAEADLLRLRVAELYSFGNAWEPDECPIGYVLSLQNPNWKEQ